VSVEWHANAHVSRCGVEVKLLFVTCYVEYSLVPEFGSVTCLAGLHHPCSRFVDDFVKWKESLFICSIFSYDIAVWISLIHCEI
jgi:hypothetical protein